MCNSVREDGHRVNRPHGPLSHVAGEHTLISCTGRASTTPTRSRAERGRGTVPLNGFDIIKRFARCFERDLPNTAHGESVRPVLSVLTLTLDPKGDVRDNKTLRVRAIESYGFNNPFPAPEI